MSKNTAKTNVSAQQKRENRALQGVGCTRWRWLGLLGLRRCAAVICVAGVVLWCSRWLGLLGLRRCAAVICMAGTVLPTNCCQLIAVN